MNRSPPRKIAVLMLVWALPCVLILTGGAFSAIVGAKPLESNPPSNQNVVSLQVTDSDKYPQDRYEIRKVLWKYRKLVSQWNRAGTYREVTDLEGNPFDQWSPLEQDLHYLKQAQRVDENLLEVRNAWALTIAFEFSTELKAIHRQHAVKYETLAEQVLPTMPNGLDRLEAIRRWHDRLGLIDRTPAIN